MNQTQFYLIIYVVLAVLAGVGEYFKLLPSGAFGSILFAVFGHAAGVFSPPPFTGGNNATTEGQKQENNQ
jgi:hypothetical protein